MVTLRSTAIIGIFFDAEILKAMLPIPELKFRMEVVSELHDKDLAAGYAGVFLSFFMQPWGKVSGLCQGFHPAMVFSTKRTYADTGYKGKQTISPA